LLWVLPAFFENHNHLGEASRKSLFVEVGDVGSIGEFVERIRQHAARTPGGQWIQTSSNWTQEQLAEKRLPTANDLVRHASIRSSAAAGATWRF
jgi:predicted amidohydrolase YtcJ